VKEGRIEQKQPGVKCSIQIHKTSRNKSMQEGEREIEIEERRDTKCESLVQV
jgi:hypothetical protein